MRSLLFVPAHKSDLIEKAFKSEADAIIFDLEDSCPGEENRKRGIENINKSKTEKKTIVRISDHDQIDQIGAVDYIMHPKAEILSGIWHKFPAILLIESALGVVNLSIMMYNWRTQIKGIAFGNEDYLADTGCSDYSFAQGTVVNCAKAFDKFAIDTVHTNVHDLVELKSICLKAVNSGFDGKLCIHPKEVEIVNKMFTPSQDQYDYARRVIELSDNEKGVAILDGVYIAPPMVKRAKKVIEKYEYYTQEH